jgi:acyl-CoA reductase-like NAD-dependent aldehyde dehydrogenase
LITSTHAEAAITAAVKAFGNGLRHSTEHPKPESRWPWLLLVLSGHYWWNSRIFLVFPAVIPASAPSGKRRTMPQRPAAAGCSMVLKPAPQTPLSALLLAEAVQQAGWPDGGLNVLPLSNEDASLLVADERIKLISFTGSASVGWQIKKNAGKKRVILELGGNAAVIVHSDADLQYAAERCVAGEFAYAGQACISVQRILVERSVYGKFTALLLAGVNGLKTGDPLEESTDLGPLIRENDAIRASDWVLEAARSLSRQC